MSHAHLLCFKSLIFGCDYCFLNYNDALGCGPPTRGTIDNGMISISETSYVVGAQLIYLCVAGFDTRVSTITECEPDFTWTLDDNPPSCTRGN